ncbi:MAG: hypothetical protein HY741_21580 [Chloroflexi bacterium]|nr:hypothetical protein [Chloroflexota bacterium]
MQTKFFSLTTTGLRLALHGGMLTACNLASIIAAFGVYYFLRPVNQILVQAPLAALFSLLAFMVWMWLAARLPLAFLRVRARGEWIGIYFAALLWTPLLFVPLHWVTQGYVTSFGNILATWAFQAPVNLLVLLYCWRKMVRPCSPHGWVLAPSAVRV